MRAPYARVPRGRVADRHLNTQLSPLRLDTVAAADRLTDAEAQAWRELLISTRLLFEALDRQLQRDSGMPHTYYTILAALVEAPHRTLAMGALARAVRASPSRLSHAVARMEADGWICRRPDPAHRRRTLAQLTDAGVDVLLAATPGHVAAVRRHLFDHLGDEQVTQLQRACAAVRAGLDADDPDPAVTRP
jgi:DNA-binding MarR family transcriptional regulator